MRLSSQPPSHQRMPRLPFDFRSEVNVEGCMAGRDGAKLSDCPYDVGTPEHSDWVRGWNDFTPARDRGINMKAFQERQKGYYEQFGRKDQPEWDDDIAALMEPDATTSWWDVVKPGPDPVDAILSVDDPVDWSVDVDKIVGWVPMSPSLLQDLSGFKQAVWRAMQQYGGWIHSYQPPPVTVQFHGLQGLLWDWKATQGQPPADDPDDPIKHPKQPPRGTKWVKQASIGGLLHDPVAWRKLEELKQAGKPTTFQQFMRDYQL